MNAKNSFAVDRQRPAGRWRSYIAVSWDKHSREASARYLRQMIDKFGAIHLAVAAYNAGPGIQVDRRAALPSLRQNFLRA